MTQPRASLELTSNGGPIGTFFDHLRQVAIRGLMAEHLNDPDYVYRPEHRKGQKDVIRSRRVRTSARTAHAARR